jgi:hypothetical protein
MEIFRRVSCVEKLSLKNYVVSLVRKNFVFFLAVTQCCLVVVSWGPFGTSPNFEGSSSPNTLIDF